jgi:hypothetical protein
VKLLWAWINLSNLDLDRAAEAVAVRLESWADLGITLLAPLTWVDFVAELPEYAAGTRAGWVFAVTRPPGGFDYGHAASFGRAA